MDIDNNNGLEQTGPVKSSGQTVSDDSPVLTVENLPKILVTNVCNETREPWLAWAPEIPFENLASSSRGSEREVGRESLDEELNNLMDISIEIESNKVMKVDYIDTWTVTLRNPEMMAEYSQQKDTTYRSSIFSLTILWIFVFVSQLFEIPNHLRRDHFGLTFSLVSGSVFLCFLLAQLVVVVAQYSPAVSKRIRDISDKFSNCQKTRKIVITFTVIMMVGACTVSSLDIVRELQHEYEGEESQDLYIRHSSQYLGYIWIVSIISLSTFIKLHYLYKAILLSVIFLLYSALIVTFVLLLPQYNILLTRDELNYLSHINSFTV